MYVYCYFSVLSINLTSFFMLETSIYVCPNLSSCVRTCAAGHSWDDRHAHLQELRGEAPPVVTETARGKASCWRERGPAAPSTMDVLTDSRKVLWFTIHLFLECHFIPCSLWNMEQFLKKCFFVCTWECDTRVTQPVERHFGTIYCAKRLTCQHTLFCKNSFVSLKAFDVE